MGTAIHKRSECPVGWQGCVTGASYYYSRECRSHASRVMRLHFHNPPTMLCTTLKDPQWQSIEPILVGSGSFLVLLRGFAMYFCNDKWSYLNDCCNYILQCNIGSKNIVSEWKRERELDQSMYMLKGSNTAYHSRR